MEKKTDRNWTEAPEVRALIAEYQGRARELFQVREIVENLKVPKPEPLIRSKETKATEKTLMVLEDALRRVQVLNAMYETGIDENSIKGTMEHLSTRVLEIKIAAEFDKPAIGRPRSEETALLVQFFIELRVLVRSILPARKSLPRKAMIELLDRIILGGVVDEKQFLESVRQYEKQLEKNLEKIKKLGGF